MSRASFLNPTLIPAVLLLALGGCDRAAAPSSPSATRPATRARTVASMVPAATDLLLAMGAGDRLVAVSNYDFDRDGIRGLPRVGDYQTTDWERLRALRPAVMIRQFAPDRVPQGLRERSADLSIELANVQINRLEDVFGAIDTLGKAIDESDKAATLTRDLRARLNAVRARVASRPVVRVLVVRDESGHSVIGPANFIDDLLPYAGATNAAAGLNNPYPEIDRELLRSLDPDAIVQLLPEAGPQKLSAAAAAWAGMPSLRAVRAGQVYPISDWYALLPGAHLPDVAEKIAAALHPADTTTRPRSQSFGCESGRFASFLPSCVAGVQSIGFGPEGAGTGRISRAQLALKDSEFGRQWPPTSLRLSACLRPRDTGFQPVRVMWDLRAIHDAERPTIHARAGSPCHGILAGSRDGASQRASFDGRRWNGAPTSFPDRPLTLALSPEYGREETNAPPFLLPPFSFLLIPLTPGGL